MPKNLDVIECIDEESEILMLAMYPSEVVEVRIRMASGDNPSESGRGDLANRYNNVYCRFTHCEFHPMMFLEIIINNPLFRT